MSQLIDQKSYSISEILRWNDESELILSPKFQRNQVWNVQAKAYLIDTILRGLPIPVIFIRTTINVQENKIFKEVIDGQQRLRALISFYNNEFAITPTRNGSRVTYLEMNDSEKELFLGYEIAVMIVKTKEDAAIYDMFARFNTNNYVLNHQELRNAKYWGEFKTLVYDLGRELKSIFMELESFDDKKLMRMRDYEFINSIVILLLDGVRADKPKVVDKYYLSLDKIFPQKEEIRREVLLYFDFVKKIIDTPFEMSVFNKPVYLYTLIACIDRYNKSINQLPDTSLLIEKLSALEYEIENNAYQEDKKIQLLIDLHTRRTTDAKEREMRIGLTYEKLFIS